MKLRTWVTCQQIGFWLLLLYTLYLHSLNFTERENMYGRWQTQWQQEWQVAQAEIEATLKRLQTLASLERRFSPEYPKPRWGQSRKEGGYPE